MLIVAFYMIRHSLFYDTKINLRKLILMISQMVYIYKKGCIYTHSINYFNNEIKKMEKIVLFKVPKKIFPNIFLFNELYVYKSTRMYHNI